MSGSIVAALAAAQAEFPKITKSQTNSHFGSKYADLADVLEVVRPTLAKHGIALVQLVEDRDDGTVLVTKLLHESGEIVSSMPLPIDGLTSQQIGSAMTYARRYAALAICGVHPEGDDDDGNAATEAGPRRLSGRSGGSQSKRASDAQRGLIERLLNETVHHSMHAKVISERVGRDCTINDLTSSEASPLIEWLKAEKKAGRKPDGDLPIDSEPWDDVTDFDDTCRPGEEGPF